MHRKILFSIGVFLLTDVGYLPDAYASDNKEDLSTRMRARLGELYRSRSDKPVRTPLMPIDRQLAIDFARLSERITTSIAEPL